MTGEQYLFLMKNPFGSKSLRKLDMVTKSIKIYNIEKNVEEVAEDLYNDPDKIDILLYMNGCKFLESKEYRFISKSDMNEFDINLNRDIRK